MKLWAVGDITNLPVWPVRPVEKSTFCKEIENKNLLEVVDHGMPFMN